MVKIAICDDEKNIRIYLSALIRKQGIECEIMEYATAGDYLASGVEYDILFLDIELECPKQNMDGMKMARQIRKCRMELHIRELCYLLLTPLTGILFGNIIFRISLVVSENLVIQLYEQYPVLIGIVPVAAALFYAGILVTIISYQKMMGFQEEKKKYFVEQQQVHAIQERMEEVEQFYEGIRRMEQYMNKMDESMNVFELAIKTGNPVTDVIVNDKQKAAKKQGIRFQSGFIYPKSERYNAYDIGIIINNLLQNALEACGRMRSVNRYISISSKQKKKFFLVEIRNSYEGEIIIDEDTNLPISTKENGTSGFLHDIGLSNVKREAEKYMGDVDIKVKKNEFIATVLLQERSRNEQHDQCKLQDKDVQ